MHSIQATMWDPQPPSKHLSPLPGPPPSSSRLTHVSTAAPAKRITFYKSGDSQFGGIRMAIHKRSFKCFDALLDDLSQKVPLPFGVRTVTTPRGTHSIQHLEQLQDGGCYLCSDRRQTKPINMEVASKRPSIWYHQSRRPQRPETSSTVPPGHLPYRQRRILLVKNSEPGFRRSIVLSRRSTRNLRAFLDEVSEVMQFHVRKLYTTEGRRIDTVQSLMTYPGVLVCVGREAFSPMLVNFIRKSSEEKLPGLGSRSPVLGPRTPGNGARSPTTQGARSPPHGAQSTASEYSEGHESKKNVNFGLETKKSIIHPRSDSSNRSTRFSLSSEKSYGNGVSAYSQSRPAVMNDDIEKRVLVNKDGSLSVEMRVRFRLHSDETVQWSTQIKKAQPLTNDSCSLTQAEPPYLQQGQSESCSDPDSTSFDPEHMDYSSQSLQHGLAANHCPCCYQRPELQYDLWENPAHCHKHPPVPPPNPQTANHTHTIVRQTHSSSSSSSCNSRRVLRCRAQLSSCRGASGSEQSQLVQEEMCMTEQVEHRVDVEQDGDTHVEVCRVSQTCSHTEVMAIEGNLEPLSCKSAEEGLEEDEGQRPVSTISSSSHILQSLKEDQDDEDEDLPPSASQCCHCSATSPFSVSQTHLNDNALSKVPTAKALNSSEEVLADDEDEEVQRVVSGFSGHTGHTEGSQKSGPISVCPVCGGCKRGVSSVSNGRVSKTSAPSHQASSNPALLPPNQENEEKGTDNNDSDDSAVSTQSNKTNLTNYQCLTNGVEGRASSAMSTICNPALAGNEDDRAPSANSAMSHRSKTSHKSGCYGATGVTAEEAKERSPSNMSAQSNHSDKSHKSHKTSCSGTAAAPDIRAREDAEGENSAERAVSCLSVKSDVSGKTNDSVKSHKSHCAGLKVASTKDNMTTEEQGHKNKRAPSSLSVKSSASGKSSKVQRPASSHSASLNVTAKFTCCKCASAVNKETGQEEGTETEERASSGMSAKSNLSVKSNKSHKSTKACVRSLSPRSETEIDGLEGLANQMLAASVKSCKSNYNNNGPVVSSDLEVGEGTEEKETEQEPEDATSVNSEKEHRAACVGGARDGATSALSYQSASSAKSYDTKPEVDDLLDRPLSAMSVKSHASATSAKSKKSSNSAVSPDPNEAAVPSVASAMSVKSKSSARSIKTVKSKSPSHKVITIKTPVGFDEEGDKTINRALSSASIKSEKSNISSALSHKSNHNKTADVAADADIKAVNNSEDTHGQMLTPMRIHSPHTDSAKVRSPHSPVQQLLHGGESTGSSVLSVHTTSVKSGRSNCHCAAASAKRNKEEQEEEGVNKDEKEELEQEQRSVQETSLTSRRGTEQSLSRNSSGSVSLGLPEDKEAAESDSGKSSVSFPSNTKNMFRVKAPDLPHNPEESAAKEGLEETGSTISRKSNSNHNKTTLSNNSPAVDIPTIQTPGEGAKSAEQKTKRTDKIIRSPCKCKVKAAAQTPESEKEEEHDSANPTKAQSVKSVSSTVDVTTNAADPANIANTSSPDCGLRPKSAVSALLKQYAGESSGKGQNSRSNAGSNKGSARMSNSQKKETALKASGSCHVNRPHSENETFSALSPSLSAGELFGETMPAVRPRSCQSKASKTSVKPRSESSTRHQKCRKQEVKEDLELELTPACLPYASPSEVVSDWLRGIPADSSMLELSDELNDLKEEKELEEKPRHEAAKEEVNAEVKTLDKEEKYEVQEEGGVKCDAVEEERSPGGGPGDAVAASGPSSLMTSESLPRNWDSSAAVMKVLLSSSLGRCQSMPEVSPVYGRRLSTSARGLLDCLAQLQLIEPAVSPACQQHKDHNQQCENIMAILQSLWLNEPKEIKTMGGKDKGVEQVTPPRSSSGVGMSSGSGASGKENGIRGEEEAPLKETESVHEAAEKEVEEKEEGSAEILDKDIKAETEEEDMTDVLEELEQSEEQYTVPKSTENPPSVDKSSAKDSSRSPTDNEQETLEDSSSCTPPTVLRAPLTKRFSQDPDPVWVLHLLKKLEKQFMSHYVTAMADFKVRWDLDDSLVLNAMITELRDEVSRRIQSSIEREMRKIQSRAGKGGRSPRPPQEGNLSRESTMTEKRRRMLKVMKNQSVKTADSLSDEEVVGDYSDQRSDDEYCPCDACVRKKMAARPLKANPTAAEAPVMKDFDLLKILQRKKSPLSVPQTGDLEEENDEEEEKNLEVVQEEEEEDETKEDIKADVVLEETIAEEEEMEQIEYGGQEEDEEEVETDVGNEEQEEEDTGSKECRKDKEPENREDEEEEEDKCQYCHGKNIKGGDKAEGQEGEMEGEESEDKRNDTGENEMEDDEERGGAAKEELQGVEDDREAETGSDEEESNKETVRQATACEGETTGKGDEREEEEEQEGEIEDSNAAKTAENEESTMVAELGEGNVSASAEDDGESQKDKNGGDSGEQEGEASERASPAQVPCLTPTVEGEEDGQEDSDADSKRETSAEESGYDADDGTPGDEEQKEEGGRGNEEEVVVVEVEEFKPGNREEEVNSSLREDGALLHQFTRTSVESQPGSLEDMDTHSPQNSLEAPEVAAGVSTGGSRGQGRSEADHHKANDSG